MDDSQKAFEYQRAIDCKFERYARSVAEQLGREAFTEGANGQCLVSYWDELKRRLHEKRPDSGRSLISFIEDSCSKLLQELTAEERRLLWLGTEAADNAGPSAFLKSTHWSQLTGPLCEKVKDLALEEAEKEASFGAGFFEHHSVLHLIGDVLAAIAQRQDLNAEVAASLQQLIDVVDALPDEAPAGFFELTLDHTVRFEDSGGSRYYTLIVSEDCLEVSLSGHEWTKEVGGDSWSGASFRVESDGSVQSDGDYEEMLLEMQDESSNPDYEVSINREY